MRKRKIIDKPNAVIGSEASAKGEEKVSFKTPFGEKLMWCIEHSSYKSIVDVCRASGVNQQTMNNLLHGNVDNPTKSKIMAIVSALANVGMYVDLNWLFGHEIPEDENSKLTQKVFELEQKLQKLAKFSSSGMNPQPELPFPKRTVGVAV